MSELIESIIQSQSQEEPGQQPESANRDDNSKHSAEFLERFNKLASKESQLRKRERDILSERDTYKAKMERLERIERLANEDPDAALGELGLNYDKLTERRLSSLGGETDKQFSTLQKEVQELKDLLAGKDKQAAEQQSTQAMQAARAEIDRICQTDEFELIRENEQQDLVLDTAAEYYQATGKILSLADAAKHVEAHLEKKLERLIQSKKFAARQQKSGEIEPKSEAQSERGLSSSLSGASRPTPTPMNEDDLRNAFWRAMGTPKG